MTNIVKRPRGRPTVYTKELANTICERLAKGETLKASQGYPVGAALKGSTGQEAWVTPTGTRPFFSKNTVSPWMAMRR